jgi:hypothetical protein
VLRHYEALGGGAVAVRSSALGEDSEDASFAGQYETILNVVGADALRAAIGECLASASNARSAAYREARADNTDVTMTVVVQRMVDAFAAGVLFTVDPVSGRRDRLVIDAVRGLGEALVSGAMTPDHLKLDPRNAIVERDQAGPEPVLPDTTLQQLAKHARDAERAVGAPLDLEWAVDHDNRVVFLQARPITHLAADPRALDIIQRPTDFYTKCNIGEMMPGAITPLTRSLTARGIDVSMQRMYVQCGALDRVAPEFRYVAVFSGHMFLNLSEVLHISTQVAGSTPEQACLAICGQRVPDAEAALPKPAGPLVQYRNLLRYGSFMLGAGKRVPAMRAQVDELGTLPEAVRFANSARAAWQQIDAALPTWWDVFTHHLAGSSPAGAMAPILLRVTAKNEPPTAEDIARVAELLSGATNVESADIAAGVDRIVDALAKHPHVSARFTDAEPEAALAWLRSADAGRAHELFEAYLVRHGHRTVRELELHQRDWADDPLPLLRSMKSALRGRTAGAQPGKRAHAASEPLTRGLRLLVGARPRRRAPARDHQVPAGEGRAASQARLPRARHRHARRGPLARRRRRLLPHARGAARVPRRRPAARLARGGAPQDLRLPDGPDLRGDLRGPPRARAPRVRRGRRRGHRQARQRGHRPRQGPRGAHPRGSERRGGGRDPDRPHHRRGLDALLRAPGRPGHRRGQRGLARRRGGPRVRRAVHRGHAARHEHVPHGRPRGAGREHGPAATAGAGRVASGMGTATLESRAFNRHHTAMEPGTVFCPLCRTPHRERAVQCDNCDHLLGAPVDLDALRGELWSLAARGAVCLGGALAFAVFSLYTTDSNGIVLLAAPFGVGVHALYRFREVYTALRRREHERALNGSGP